MLDVTGDESKKSVNEVAVVAVFDIAIALKVLIWSFGQRKMVQDNRRQLVKRRKNPHELLDFCRRLSIDGRAV